MMTWPLIAFGGAVGAVLRFVLDGEMKARGPRTWPHSTFAVNLLGSFVLGVLTAHPRPGWLSALVVTGICGGFTTFSGVAIAAALSSPLGAIALLAVYFVVCVGAWLLGDALRTRTRASA